MNKMRMVLVILLGAFLFAGCSYPGVPARQGALQAVSGSPQAWVDAPLDGMHLPLAPYEVVFHVSDVSGVTRGELSVNGQVLASLPNPDPAQKLATLRQVWTPSAPGVYTLSARAQNTAGVWGSPVSVKVTIGGKTITPTPTLSPTPTLTLTAVITVTPTATTTPTSTPSSTPTPAELTFSPEVSPVAVVGGPCSRDQITFRVTVSDPSRVSSMVLFTRLADRNSAGASDWDGGTAMSPAGNGIYQVVKSAASLPNPKGFSSASVQYQFAAASSGQVVGRSPVYSDVAYTACGQPQPPVATTQAPHLVPVQPSGPTKTPTLPLLRRNTVPPLKPSVTPSQEIVK